MLSGTNVAKMWQYSFGVTIIGALIFFMIRERILILGILVFLAYVWYLSYLWYGER